MPYARRSVDVYESVDDYVSSFSRKASPNIIYPNVENLLIYFCGVLFLISLVFVVDLLSTFSTFSMKFTPQVRAKRKQNFLASST